MARIIEIIEIGASVVKVRDFPIISIIERVEIVQIGLISVISNTWRPK